jgi:hypothetical protein
MEPANLRRGRESRHDLVSPLSPTDLSKDLHATPSAREKEVSKAAPLPGTIPDSKFSEKDVTNFGFSPISPVTNYHEKPHEAPQVISTDPKFLVNEKDVAEEAPQVVDPSNVLPLYSAWVDHPQRQMNGDQGQAHATSDSNEGSSRESSDGSGGSGKGLSEANKRRICGLPAVAFYALLVITLLIVVGGAVGGGVGGAMSVKNTKEAAAAAASATSAIMASQSSAAAQYVLLSDSDQRIIADNGSQFHDDTVSDHGDYPLGQHHNLNLAAYNNWLAPDGVLTQELHWYQ